MAKIIKNEPKPTLFFWEGEWNDTIEMRIETYGRGGLLYLNIKEARKFLKEFERLVERIELGLAKNG